MQVVRGTRHLEAPLGPVLTIGNFDGVHLGHRALIDRTVALAAEVGAPAAALTFHPSPQEVLRPDSASPRLQSLEQRLEQLAETGLSFVIVEPFTRELGSLDAAAFATRYLLERIGVRGLVLGHDFRFGRGRAGTVAYLQENLPIPVQQVSAVLSGDVPVSSSRIRAALAEGRVEVAARLLGRSHEVRGVVEEGHQRGRDLGFPTANLGQLEGLVPADGVYAVRAEIGARWRPAVANIGSRPTFHDAGRSVEVHVLDFRGELYGERMPVSFEAHLRPERRFDSIDELTAAIRRDADAARELLA